MKIEIELNEDYSHEYVNSRNKIAATIKHLEQLKDFESSNRVRDLLHVLNTMGVLYLANNNLPVTIAELQLQNHVQAVEIKKLRKEIEQLNKLKL